MNELEITIAAPFIHSQEGALSQTRLIFYYVQDKRWITIDEAKRLIALGERKGLISKNEKNEFVPQPALLAQKIPLGFKPTDAIFASKETNVVEELLEHIASVSKNNIKDLLQQTQEIRKDFDNLIGDDTAIVILAKKYGVDIIPYREKLITHIETNH